MKARILWSMVLLAIVTLLVWAPPGAASIPPLREDNIGQVQVTNNNINIVNFKVYDPQRGWKEVTVDTGGTINGYLRSAVKQGVVTWWYIVSQNNYGYSYALGFAVYDPYLGEWKIITDTLSDVDCPIYDCYFIADNGLVVYYQPDGENRDAWIKVCTYDPTAHAWLQIREDLAATNSVRALSLKDGVLAWGVGNQSGYLNSVHYGAFVPHLGWQSASTDLYVVNMSFELQITNATVSWTTLWGDSYVAGYGAGGWYSGPTQARAGFVAFPTSGNAPMGVWFWDFSLSWASRSWKFGDGGTSTEPSTYYSYTIPGQYTAIQTVEGVWQDSVAITVNDITPPTGTVRINNGEDFSCSPSVTLYLAATDDSGIVKEMRISDRAGGTGWVPYATTRSWTFNDLSFDEQWVKVQFRDAAGNVSAEASSQILVDTGPPYGGVTINSGAAYTQSTAVTLTLDWFDDKAVSQIALSNDRAIYVVVPFSSPFHWGLTFGEGKKTVWLRLTDICGKSTEVSSDIILDTTPPTGTIAINSGAAYTKTTAVTLNLSATDTAGGLDKMQFSNDNATWSALETYAATKAWILASGDGTKTVYARFKDKAGNVSAAVSDTIILDATPPTGTIAINGGAAYTGSTAVTLNLTYDDGTGSGMDQMRFSNSTDFSAATWIPVAATAPWTLAAGTDGTRTVYAQFKDKVGNISTATISDSIILDTQPPTGAVVINGGADFTNSLAVTLTLNATDGTGSGLDKMQFSNDGVGWSAEQTYAPSYGPWNLSAGTDGSRRVYARFKDKSGKYSTAVISDTIVLDTTAPSGNITINNGDAYATSTAVTLTLAATDGTGSGLDKMRFNGTGTFGSEPWAYYTTSAPYTLPGGDGSKKVYAQFKDKAGNVSAAVSDSIILDATPPTGTIAISGGAYTRIAAVTLNLSANGATQMCFSADKTAWLAWEAVAATRLYNLGAPDGLKWVYVKYRDAAGNESAAAGASVTLDTLPPKDGALKATAGNKQVTLTWSGFSDVTSGISAYRLYYSASGYPTAATGTKIYEGTALTFTHKNLTNGKPCYYRLVAVDKAGSVSTGATAAATPKAGRAPAFLNLLLD